MSWTNFHGHCHYCDGAANPEDYLKKALEEGFLAYGFSSHAPLQVNNAWSMKAHLLQAYLQEIERLKAAYSGLIEVYKGLEVDYIPGISSPNQCKQQWGLDYVIGSVHYVDCLPDGNHWEIDGAHSTFQRGIQEIFDNIIPDFLETYFGLIREMVQQHTPDVVGHLDKIKIHNHYWPYFPEGDPSYRAQIEHTLEVIRDKGSILEVNTRGLYTRKSTETYPSPWVLERANALQVPIMLNSDAHRPEEISKAFEPAAVMLQQLGFKELMILQQGSWQAVSFNQKGINKNKHEKTQALAPQAK